MENASKALIMAAGVLIALIILGALILMFSNLSNYQDTNIQTDREAQIVEFNNQYVTYDRDDVRGSDLYSLANKVIDYNRRKSSAGTGNDEGQSLQYQPMKLTIKLKKNTNNNLLKELSPDGQKRLFGQETYVISNKDNQLERIHNIIKDLEDTLGGSDIGSKLTTASTKIFISDGSTQSEKNDAIKTYESITKTKGTTWDNIKTNSPIRNNVYTYYEYIQFKRAYFDCETDKTKYDDKTGRITEMTFVYNGKIQ